MGRNLWCVVVMVFMAYSTLPSAEAPPLTPSHIMNVELSKRSQNQDDKCSFCIESVKIIRDIIQANLTLEDVFPLLQKLCTDIMKDYSSAAYMCPGMIFSYGPVVQYVFTEKFLDPKNVCEHFHLCYRLPSLIMPTRNKGFAYIVSQEKAIAEQNDKTKIIRRTGILSKSYSFDGKQLSRVKNLPRVFSISRKQHSGLITFVQISDIHLDHDYAEGSSVDCGLYLCCRRWYNGTGAKAGHYGSYHCDLPLVTLDLLLDNLRALYPKPDFIIYTGDNPPHDIWNETWTSQLNATDYVVKYIASKLPNISIYPAFGNHETWPESEYMGTLPQYEHLTKKLSDYWQQWVHFPQEALDTIARGGYYSIRVLNNLRLISFNSNYGYTANIFTYLNDQNDHYWTQWKWIMEELSLAEDNGEKEDCVMRSPDKEGTSAQYYVLIDSEPCEVLIIAHIPPGDSDNVAEYGEFYLNMTKMYSNTIVGHLFGHTHKDQFQLIQDEEGVYGVAMVSPSVTPYPNVNPSFRVFMMDIDSLTLTKYQQYHLNLTKANEMYQKGSQSNPHFELSYSTSEEYELHDLSAQSWANLVERFYQFPFLTKKYHYNIYGKSSVSDEDCSQECQKEILCSVSNIVSANYRKCIANTVL